MSADQGINEQTVISPPSSCMESVNRISKLPVVESTIQTATSIYEKVKDYNSVTHWTLSTAESTVNKAVEVGKPIATPVIRNLEGPIKKVDDVLCSGLDYVESKIPAVKLPPGEFVFQIYTSTKEYVNSTVTPAVESAYAYAEPAVKTAKEIVEPVVQTAKHAVEPAVEKVKSIVEPIVQPAVENAAALKENIMHRVDGYLGRCQCHEGESVECKDCQNVREKLEKGGQNVTEKLEKGGQNVKEKLEKGGQNVKEKLEKGGQNVKEKLEKLEQH